MITSVEELVDPAPRTARASRRLVLSLIGVVLLAVVCGIAVLNRGRGPDLATGSAPTHLRPMKVALPRPPSITLDGETYRVEQTGASAISPTPAGLRVWVFDAEGGSPGCTHVRPSARVVAQRSRVVVVAAFDYSGYEAAQGSGRSCAYAESSTVTGTGLSTGTSSSTGTLSTLGTSSDESPSTLYKGISLHLSAPLGNRTVVDARSGDVLGVTGRFHDLAPHFVPSGYSPDLHQSFSPSSEFVALRQYRNGQDVIEIRGRSGSSPLEGARTIGTTTVDGVRARITDENYERCVSWGDRDGFARQVCSLTEKSPRLNPAQLTRIARSLR